MLQQGLLATCLVPGCVGRGVKLGSESLSAGGGAGGVWKSGNLEIWNLGIWNHPKTNKHRNIKIKIRATPNVGKVYISSKHFSLTLVHAISGIFPWAGQMPNMFLFLAFFLGGPTGPIAAIHPTWGYW